MHHTYLVLIGVTQLKTLKKSTHPKVPKSAVWNHPAHQMSNSNLASSLRDCDFYCPSPPRCWVSRHFYKIGKNSFRLPLLPVKLFKLSNRLSYVGTLTSISGHFHVEILHLAYTRFFFKPRLHFKNLPSSIYHAYTHQTMHTELCCHQLYTPLCFLSKLALKFKLCILLAKQVIRPLLPNGKSEIHTISTGPFQIYPKIFPLLYVMMKYVFFSPFLSVENRSYRWHEKDKYQQRKNRNRQN